MPPIFLESRVAMIDISGKTAIVTGAASGIGFAIATALTEAGANVVTGDMRKETVAAAQALSAPRISNRGSPKAMSP